MSGKQGSLVRGANDSLLVSTNPSNAVIRDYVASQGDTTVHFSGVATETSGEFSVKRFVLVTEAAVYRIPQSAVDTGVFFDCRTPLKELTQVVCVDENGDGASCDVLFFGARSAANDNQATLLFTLEFVTGSVRKNMLLCLCLAAPTLPLLQKRPVSVDRGSLSPPPNAPSRSAKKADATSPRKTTAATPAVVAGGAAGGQHRLVSSEGGSLASDAAPSEGAHGFTDTEFEKQKTALRAMLHNHMASSTAIDEPAPLLHTLRRQEPSVGRSQSRAEELPERQAEREEIKAMLMSREAKVVQNIEWKMRYPHRGPIRVAPGVEFDKAHEAEINKLPNGFNEYELLGPSLHPLWLQWKRTGGLMNPDPAQWSLYDSQDLIDSLQNRHEVLYGIVGEKDLFRIEQMCGLVKRERTMFLNKQNLHRHADATSASGSASPARSRKPLTVPQPFTLSQSPSLNRKLKVIDTEEFVSDMKAQFQKHQRALHAMRKSQLEKDLQRAAEE